MQAVQRPRVVLFTGSFVMGGMEEHVIRLGEGLTRRGFEVATICSQRDEIRPLRETLTHAGVRVHGLSEAHGSGLARFGRLHALVRTLRAYRDGVLHIHAPWVMGGDLVLLAARLAGVKAVVRTEHARPTVPFTLRERLWTRIRDKLLTRIIWVSAPVQPETMAHIGRFAPKCTIVYNGVDLGRYSPDVSPDGVHAEFRLDPSVPLVGAVARLGEHRKGISYFLDMAGEIARETPDARFLIVGDGPLRPELEHQAEQLGIANRVIFAGERSDIPRLLAAMRVFVMPSLYEGCQYTLLEAMAMAKPIVSTEAGVAPEVIEDGRSGFLVASGDGTALARGVRELLADPAAAVRMGLRAREIIEAGFGLETMVDNITNVYAEVA